MLFVQARRRILMLENALERAEERADNAEQ